MPSSWRACDLPDLNVKSFLRYVPCRTTAVLTAKHRLLARLRCAVLDV
jgi:hypothetical protein